MIASPQAMNVMKQAVVNVEQLGDEMGAVGGARQREIPAKGILAVKIKTKRKKILSAIPEIRPDNISLLPKKKNIIFNFSEEVRIWESL